MRRFLEPICIALCIALAALAVPAVAVAQGERWTVYSDERGMRVQVPRHLFSIERDSDNGRRFVSADGHATLHVYSGSNRAGETPAQTLRRTVAERDQLTYQRVARNFFAISARHGGQILYRRCNFNGGQIYCLDLTYPQSEKRAWDYPVTRISRSLRPL